MMSPTPPSIWAIVPAAGSSRRMQSETPKQYLPLLGQTLIEHTLNKLLSLPEISGIVVALHQDDARWDSLSLARHPRIHRVEGGSERCDSVLNGLRYCLDGLADAGSWALVHDAARPCVSRSKIEELIRVAVQNSEQTDGAILAVPAADTVKRVFAGHTIAHTEDRSQLWLAHTPQLFPAQKLLAALLRCREQNLSVTDEASAIEALGGKVQVVQDRRDNIKVTLPEDILWATTLLKGEM